MGWRTGTTCSCTGWKTIFQPGTWRITGTISCRSRRLLEQVLSHQWEPLLQRSELAATGVPWTFPHTDTNGKITFLHWDWLGNVHRLMLFACPRRAVKGFLKLDVELATPCFLFCKRIKIRICLYMELITHLLLLMLWSPTQAMMKVVAEHLFGIWRVRVYQTTLKQDHWTLSSWFLCCLRCIQIPGNRLLPMYTG